MLTRCCNPFKYVMMSTPEKKTGDVILKTPENKSGDVTMSTPKNITVLFPLNPFRGY